MKVRLRYGRDDLEMELPGGADVHIFRTKGMAPLEDPVEHLLACLKNPIGSPPLEKLAAGRRDACIVVSDITRPAPNKTILPHIIQTLEQAGIPPRHIRVLVATGIHRPSTREELIEMLGDEIPARYRVISHDARDPSQIVRIGVSPGNIPIDINHLYIESDLKIIIGLVEPHFMAGYSGGRKSIAVGLTSIDTIRHLHGTKMLEHPGARNCELAGNPLHRELTAMTRAAGADFSVNAVIDAERQIGGMFCGDLVDAHTAACGFVERHSTIRAESHFDIVITTGAGYPLDTTYYQAIKGLVGALDILVPGGGIILAAQCSDGLGSDDFRRVLQKLGTLGDYDEFIEHISDSNNFVVDQWEVEMLVKALRMGKVYLYSTGISGSDWALTYATKIRSVEDGLSRAIAKTSGKPRIAIIPEGPYVIPLQ